MKLFNLEIDVTEHEYETRTGRWASYGTIVAEGNTLEELLDNASIDAMDQDGGEVYYGPADSSWMQDLIEQEYKTLSLPQGTNKIGERQ